MGMQYSLLSEINKKSIGTYINNLLPLLFYYPDFFPAESTDELKYDTLIGSEGRPVAADIVSYNSSAPIKTRKVIDKLTGTIPSERVKRVMQETDLNKYNQLKRMANPDQDKLLKLVFDDVNFVHKSVRGRLEWIALKILSYPALTLTKSVNNGIVTESAIDFQMPSANKSAAAIAWSGAVGTTTPITDFITTVATAKTYGVTLKYALMNETDWGYFSTSTETKNYTSGFIYAGAGIKLTPTKEQANDMLKARALPTILIIDQTITIEDDDHTQTTANPWTTGYVTFIPDLAVGRMLYGPIAEEDNPPKQVTQSKADGVLITKFSDVDPVQEFTKGECNAFPSWTRVDECFNMYVLATVWS